MNFSRRGSPTTPSAGGVYGLASACCWIALHLFGLARHLGDAGLGVLDLGLGPPGAHAHDAHRGGRGQERGTAAAHGDLRSGAHRSPPEREYTRGAARPASGVEWGFAARLSGRRRNDGTHVA